jgi:hypothetical protein
MPPQAVTRAGQVLRWTCPRSPGGDRRPLRSKRRTERQVAPCHLFSGDECEPEARRTCPSRLSTREDRGLGPIPEGQRAAVIPLDARHRTGLHEAHREWCPWARPPHEWLGRLLIAWVSDPDGNPIQIVQPSNSQHTHLLLLARALRRRGVRIVACMTMSLPGVPGPVVPFVDALRLAARSYLARFSRAVAGAHGGARPRLVRATCRIGYCTEASFGASMSHSAVQDMTWLQAANDPEATLSPSGGAPVEELLAGWRLAAVADRPKRPKSLPWQVPAEMELRVLPCDHGIERPGSRPGPSTVATCGRDHRRRASARGLRETGLSITIGVPASTRTFPAGQ